MLIDFFSNKMTENFGHTLTSSQQSLVNKVSTFVLGHQLDPIFLMKGYAGTGKTTAISALVKTLNEFKLKSVLLAPTGRAAKVLASYTGCSANTIHKKIYRQQSSSDGFGAFGLNDNLHKDTIFIIDEASMISNGSAARAFFGSGRLLDDLLQYVFMGERCKLMIVGDTAQLPPVGNALSPALDSDYLQGYGKPLSEVELVDVVRQKIDSGILYNATYLREKIQEEDYFSDFPNFKAFDFEDVCRVTGEDLIDKINDSYDMSGMEDSIIVCRSNKRANQYNLGIRKSILWREDELSVGDYLMIVKNNYFWLKKGEKVDFIANGD